MSSKDKKASKSSDYRAIYGLIRPFKIAFAVFAFVMLLSSFFESFGLAMLFPLFEIILGQESGSQLSRLLVYPLKIFGADDNIITISILFLSVILIKLMLLIVTTYLSNKLCFDIRKYIVLKINDYYMSASYGKIIKEKQGVLINNLIYEPQKVTAGFLKITELLISLSMIVCYYALLLAANLRVTIIFTAVSILLYAANSIFSKRISFRLGLKEIDINQKINAIGAESISALRQIKTFCVKDIIEKRLKRSVEELSYVELKKLVFQAIPRLIIELLFFGAIILAIIVLYKHSLELLQSLIPVLTLFAIVSQRLTGQLTKILSSKIALDYHIPSFRLVKALVDEGEIISAKPKNVTSFKNLNTDIYFQEVTFGYEGKEHVIRGASFAIPRGKTTAIVGESGIGKSTLADLILGLYLPESGEVRFNGITTRDVNIVEWREKIGFVSQESFLFHTTIMENIRIGNLNASDDKVMDAARRANAHEFIMGFPRGYKTVVGDRGLLISGGQKQRIAIARALVRDPEILVFDEATSALDYKTEAALQKEIFDISRGKTVVIISHRLETVREADKILKVGTNGAVCEVKDSDMLKTDKSENTERKALAG